VKRKTRHIFRKLRDGCCASFSKLIFRKQFCQRLLGVVNTFQVTFIVDFVRATNTRRV